MIHHGRAVLAMYCVLASAESRRGRPLNSVVRAHVKTIAEAVPEFALEVAGALVAGGHAKVGPLIGVGVIERCTYDSSVGAGYIYVVQDEPPLPGRPSVAQTIPFAAPHWFNVDIAQNGGIFGIEILGRSDIIGQLRDARAL